MKHLMLDLYGVRNEVFAADTVNEIMNKIIRGLSLKAVMPVENIPYYYGKKISDGGISSFCILDNGHITLHTFPFYKKCYADILFDDFDESKVKPLFDMLLKPSKIDMWCFDRDSENCPNDYDDKNDFGPHLLLTAVSRRKYSIDDIYELLESAPEQIKMHPITRPVVVTNRRKDYDVVSGIIIIAESHIAFHVNIKTGKIYFDIYSCKFCDVSLFDSLIESLFGTCNYQLVSRGAKHDEEVSGAYYLTDNGWKENI